MIIVAGWVVLGGATFGQPPGQPPAPPTAKGDAKVEAKPEPAKEAKAAKSPLELLAERMEIHRDLAYVENGHERQKLDLYVQKTDDGPLPLIVWIHGGGWQGGSKDMCPMATEILRGYAVASINYRLSQHAIYPAQIDDCQTALRWLRKHASQYKLDPDRIGVAGASAGGHLAALVGVLGGKTRNHPDRVDVQCVVDVFGPADFLTIWSQSDPKTTVIKHNELDSPEGRLFGGPIPVKTELARHASPVTHVTKESPPYLILHGKKDRLVPWQQSAELDVYLKKADVESTLILVETAGHDGGVTSPHGKTIDAFFDRHLKNVKGHAKK